MSKFFNQIDKHLHIKPTFYYFVFFGLIISCNPIEEKKQKSSENIACREFGYLMTKSDSLAAFQFFSKRKQFIEANEGHYNGNPYSYNIHHLINTIDTSFYSKITFDYYQKSETFEKKYGTTYGVLEQIVSSDAVIYGKVFEKDNYCDTCLYYTTTYQVKTEKVLHSYFPVERGDIVLLKTNLFGYVGGCIVRNGNHIFKSSPNSYDYSINDEGYFFLKKANYISKFNIITNSNKYHDTFYDNGFELPLNNKKLSDGISNSDISVLNITINKITNP